MDRGAVPGGAGGASTGGDGFGDERWYDLIVIPDDATSEICYAQRVEEESTGTVMAGLKAIIESKGLFCSVLSTAIAAVTSL